MENGQSVLGPILVLVAVCGSPQIAEADGQMAIGTNFWNPQWHRRDDLFKDGWDNVSGSDPWNPTFLDQTSSYGVLRMMDLDRINNSQIVDWSERTQQSDQVQVPTAYEWMIDLANRQQSDLWLNIPAQANWDYSTQLASLVKTQLDPNLKVYIEYSNETWNGSFSQFQYNVDQGVALNLPGLNQYYQGWAYHVYAAVRHFENFQDVFGDQADRVIEVLAGQGGNRAVLWHHLDVLDDSVVNPNGIQPDAYAIAPYFGRDLDGDDPEVWNKLATSVDAEVERVRLYHEGLEGTGIDLIAYEGGQHLTQNADVVSSDPRIYDVYMDYLNKVDDYMSVYAHYVHVGNWGNSAWGAMQFTGQSINDAHKYRALMDYIGDDGGDDPSDPPNPAPSGVLFSDEFDIDPGSTGSSGRAGSNAAWDESQGDSWTVVVEGGHNVAKAVPSNQVISLTRGIDTTGFDDVSLVLSVFQDATTSYETLEDTVGLSPEWSDFLQVRVDLDGTGQWQSVLLDHGAWNGEDEPGVSNWGGETGTADVTASMLIELPQVAADNPNLQIQIRVFGSQPQEVWFLDSLSVLANPIGLDGDYNEDGTVGLADYTVWRDMLGRAVAIGTGADGNADGIISELDYDVWKLNFGMSSPQQASAANRVPEPATIWLLSSVVALLVYTRCSRSQSGK